MMKKPEKPWQHLLMPSTVCAASPSWPQPCELGSWTPVSGVHSQQRPHGPQCRGKLPPTQLAPSQPCAGNVCESAKTPRDLLPASLTVQWPEQVICYGSWLQHTGVGSHVIDIASAGSSSEMLKQEIAPGSRSGPPVFSWQLFALLLLHALNSSLMESWGLTFLCESLLEG